MGVPKKRLQYRYDAAGNRTGLTDPDGGRFTYSYDVMNRLTQAVNPQGQRTSYSYDALGRRTLKKLANGTRTSFSYDAASRLTSLFHLKSDGTVLSSFRYRYDNAGNRTGVTEADGSRVTWSYDATYQLTGEHRTGTTPYRHTFTYDSRGNRTLKNENGQRTTYAYDAANQLRYSQASSGRTTYTFDADGNQQAQREPAGQRTTYSWDFENRMTSERRPDGSRSTMAYDPEGLRASLEDSAGVKKFVWDEQNYLAETDGSDDTQAVYTNEPNTYGNLISQRRGSATNWFHFDAIGSTRQVTNSSAAVTDTRLYDAWGVELSQSGTTVFPFGYVGELGYYADPSGRLYVRARYLEPSIAAWMSVDELSGVAVTVGLYIAADNNPLILVDPSGLIAVTRTGAFLDGLHCGGQASFASWAFTRATNRPVCDGFFVQKVTVSCEVCECDPGTKRCGKYEPGKPPFVDIPKEACRTERLTYLEAWYVPANIAGPANDIARYLQSRNGWGRYHQSGEVRFYCAKDTGIAFINVDANSTEKIPVPNQGKWSTMGNLGSVCKTSAGRLPRILLTTTGSGDDKGFDPDKPHEVVRPITVNPVPAFWNRPPVESGRRLFAVDWYCCSKNVSSNPCFLRQSS